MMTTEQEAAPAQEPPRILLVEDDAAVRRSLQLLLQAKGFDVRSHATGLTLLADPAIPTAACFIADYQMDDLDGIQVLSRLRGDGWNGPAILITAYPSAELTARAFTAGFSDVIDKPFRDQLLANRVNSLIQSYRSGIAPE